MWQMVPHLVHVEEVKCFDAIYFITLTQSDSLAAHCNIVLAPRNEDVVHEAFV